MASSGFDRFMEGMAALRQVGLARQDKKRQKQEWQAEYDLRKQEIEDRKARYERQAQLEDIQQNISGQIGEALGNNPDIPENLRGLGKAAGQAGLLDNVEKLYKTFQPYVPKTAEAAIFKATQDLNSPDESKRVQAQKLLMSAVQSMEVVQGIKAETQGDTTGRSNFLRGIVKDEIGQEAKVQEVNVNDYFGILKKYEDKNFIGDNGLKPGAAEELIKKGMERGLTYDQATYFADNVVTNFKGTDIKAMKTSYGTNLKLTVPAALDQEAALQARSGLVDNPEQAAKDFANAKQERILQDKEKKKFIDMKLKVLTDGKLQKQIERALGKKFKDLTSAEMDDAIRVMVSPAGAEKISSQVQSDVQNIFPSESIKANSTMMTPQQADELLNKYMK